MSIRTKLLLGYLTIALLTGTIGYLSFEATRTVRDEVARISEELLPGIEALDELRHAGERIVSYTGTLAFIRLEGDQARLAARKKEIADEKKAFSDALDRYRSLVEKGHPRERAYVEKIAAAGSAILATSDEVAARIDDYAPLGTFLELTERLDAADGAFVRAIHEALAHVTKELAEGEAHLASAIVRSFRTILLTSVTTIVLALVIGASISTYMSWRINRLKEVARLIGQGQFGTRIGDRSADELGELAAAFNGMAENLNGYRDELVKAKAYTEDILRSMFNSLIVVNPQYTIMTVNKSTCSLLGYAEEELVGKRLDRVLADGFLDAADMDRLREEGFASTLETRYRNKGGDLIPVEFSVSVLRDPAAAVTGLVCVASDISARKLAEEQISCLAYYDGITGLANRTLFEEHLEQAIVRADRDRPIFSLIFLDIDNFKQVNDTLGHRTGDLLLMEIASRLKGCLRKSDTLARPGESAPDYTLARLGGDEFTIINADIARAEDAGIVARRILQAVAEPMLIDGHELVVTASIGIAIYPLDSENAEDLVRSADMAMYSAKASGRNNYQFFTQAMNDAVLRRQAVETQLRRALAREEFVLHYQPQLDLRSGEVIGAEALVRWQHPEVGMVPPAEFIPLAEESGLILPLGEWVLRAACDQHRLWREAGCPPRKVAVNISGYQFKEQGFARKVAAILRQTGMNPRSLVLEITESILMQDTEKTIGTMNELKEMGIGLAIDDFGTGYSSLSYLSRFPLYALKVDRSFIKDVGSSPHAAAITSAIIAMARSLKLQVIAEGVETEEHLVFLRQLGCDQMQGYLLGAPLPAAEVAKLFAGDAGATADGLAACRRILDATR